MFPSTLSREISRLTGKQNCFPRSREQYCFPFYSSSLPFCVRLLKVYATPVASISVVFARFFIRWLTSIRAVVSLVFASAVVLLFESFSHLTWLCHKL